jgi:Na+-transporting NADH:ubiquinone oxidoreductase subunit NqrC
METMYFVLGMLSIIATAIVSVMVWGIVKINKQQQWLDRIQREFNEAPRELHARFADAHRDLDDRASWIHRRIDETDAALNRRMDQDNEHIYREIADCRAYVDSRIDKALGAKQVIKG